MTELSFLLDLLLTEKLSKPVKEKITVRVRDVEANFKPMHMQSHMQIHMQNNQLPPQPGAQSPSTLALMQKHAAQGHPPLPVGTAPTLSIVPEPAPQPGVTIASPQAAMAIQSREIALAAAISGKPEQGRKSPRKF